ARAGGTACPGSAWTGRRLPTAITERRRMRSSKGWLHGPCATCLPYNSAAIWFRRHRPFSQSGGRRFGRERRPWRRPDKGKKEHECYRDVDREHREDALIAEARQEDLCGDEDRQRDRDRFGRGLESGEDPCLVGRDQHR